jgi:uncharacterized membrane-anchored protein YhcB (DUF1043 family)
MKIAHGYVVYSFIFSCSSRLENEQRRQAEIQQEIARLQVQLVNIPLRQLQAHFVTQAETT